MITKEQFDNLKVGDLVSYPNGETGIVEKKLPNNCLLVYFDEDDETIKVNRVRLSLVKELVSTLSPMTEEGELYDY